MFVRPTRENAARVLTALGNFGAPLFGATIDDLATAGLVLQIGIAPGRVDILNDIEGVTFDEAHANKTVVELSGVRLPVIGLDALIKNKLAVGRTEDLRDVKMLRKANNLD